MSTVFPQYWLQKSQAAWSAACEEAESVEGITADWGENLTTAPSIAVGKPVRVEVGLLDTTEAARGRIGC